MTAPAREARPKPIPVLNIRNGSYITFGTRGGAPQSSNAAPQAASVAPEPAATDEIKEDNRRWAHRRSSTTAATISGDGVGDPLPCIVLDTSSTGARVKPHFSRAAKCQSIDELPATFTLTFTMDLVAVDCRVAWRRKGEVGLRFTSPSRSVPKPVRKMQPRKA